MRRLSPIDFQTTTRWPAWGMALAGVACVALAAVAHGAWRLQQSNDGLAASLPSERPKAPRAAQLSDSERRALRQISAITSRLQAPWLELLAAIESHSSPNVGLLRLEPDARQMHLRIQAEARDEDAMFKYLVALEADERLVDVQLMNHQQAADAPGRPVRFLLRAGWRHDTASPRDEASPS